MINVLLNNYLVNKINPDSKVVGQASDSQKRLKEILENKLQEDKSLPYLLEGEDFLFGSAIRKTKPAPFDDIDLMLVLDGATLMPYEDGAVVGSVHGSGRIYNPLFSNSYLNESGYISSEKILNKIRNVIRETYPRSDIKKDGQAINVWMDSYGFGIDIVPAFKINHVRSGIHYYIPEGTGSSMWRSTNPWSDLIAFEKEDQRLNGLLTMTARLMRKWNELSNNNRLSGFHVDALVYSSLFCKNIKSLESALSTCFNSFHDLLSKDCPQFSGFAPHIDHKLNDNHRAKSKEAVQNVKNAIFNIDIYRAFGKDNTFLVWDKIFGGELLK